MAFDSVRYRWTAVAKQHDLLPSGYEVCIRKHPDKYDQGSSVMVGGNIIGNTAYHEYNRFVEIISQSEHMKRPQSKGNDPCRVNLDILSQNPNRALVTIHRNTVHDITTMVILSPSELATLRYMECRDMICILHKVTSPPLKSSLNTTVNSMFQMINLDPTGIIDGETATRVEQRRREYEQLHSGLLSRLNNFELIRTSTASPVDLFRILGCSEDTLEGLMSTAASGFHGDATPMSHNRLGKSQLLSNFGVLIALLCKGKHRSIASRLRQTLFRLERFISGTLPQLRRLLNLVAQNLRLANDVSILARRLSLGSDQNHLAAKLSAVSDPNLSFHTRFNDGPKVSKTDKIQLRLMNDLLRVCYMKGAVRQEGQPGVALQVFRSSHDVSEHVKDSTDNFVEHGYSDRDLKRLSNRIDTHSCKEFFPTMAEFLNNIQEHNLPALSQQLMRSTGTFDKAVEFLSTTRDRRLPYLNRNRCLTGFSNGILIASEGRFIHHSDPIQKIPSQLMVLKYHANSTFDLSFFDAVLRHFDNDPAFIPAENVEKILRAQKWGKGTRDWFHIMFGRLRWNVGTYDNWQVMPYFKGVAGSGKSTFMDIISSFFEPGDVGQLNHKIEVTFGLENLFNKKLITGRDIGRDFRLDQALWNSMVTGERVSVCRKFLKALSIDWKTPMVCAGNVLPAYTDNDFSMSRRMVVFFLDQIVQTRDPELTQRYMDHDIPGFMYKCALYYRRAVETWGDKSVWQVIDPQFLINRQSLLEECNNLEGFLRQQAVLKHPIIAAKMRGEGVSGGRVQAARISRKVSEEVQMEDDQDGDSEQVKMDIAITLEEMQLGISGTEIFKQDPTGTRTALTANEILTTSFKVFSKSFANFAKSRNQKKTALCKEQYTSVFAKYGILLCEVGPLFDEVTILGIQVPS